MTVEYYFIEPTKIISNTYYYGYPTTTTTGSKGIREPNSLTTTEFDITRPTIPGSSDVMETSMYISILTVQTVGEFQRVSSREAIAWGLVSMITLMFIGLISTYFIAVGWKYWKRQKKSNEDQVTTLQELISNPSCETPDTSMKTNINEAAEAEKENNL